MAAKKHKKVRSPATDVSAAQAISLANNASARPNGDWVAPAVYGVFFLFLFLGCSPALESKFVLPKAIVLCAGVLALGILLSVRNWRGHAVAPPRSVLLLSLALGIWWMISTPFALHLPSALHGEYNRYNGLWTHLCWLALFVASMAIPSDLISVRRIAAVMAAAIVPVALVNIAETIGLSAFGLKELSTLGDRVAASALMNFAIPFVVIALIRVRHWGLKAGLGALLALLVISEFLSQGRGPWIGLITAVFILAVGLIRSKAGWKIVVALLLALVLLAGLAAKLSPMAAARFASFTQIGHDENLKQRFVIYQAALQGIREHPIAGIGFDNFRNAYPRYRSAEDRYFFKGVVPTMVHNGYLQAALTNGIPALLLYLALVAGVLLKLLRQLSHAEDRDRHDLLLAFSAALCAYLVQDLVGWLDMSVTSSFWVVLGLALNLAGQNAACSSVTCAAADTPFSSSLSSWTKPVMATVAGLMLLLSLYLLNDRLVRAAADAQLFKAQTLDSGMQWPQVESLVNKALLSLPGDSRTEMIAGQLYAVRFSSFRDPRAYARGRELLESSYNHNRFDRLRLFNIVALESTALDLGQISAASDFAQKAITTLMQTDSDNPDLHEVRAWFLAEQGQFGEAIAAIREAQRLAPQEERLRSRELEYQARLK